MTDLHLRDRASSRAFLSTRRLRPTLAAVAAAVVTCLAASPASTGGFLDNSAPADPVKPEWAVPGKRVAVEGEGEDALGAKLQNARMRVEEAQQNATTAEYNYTRARTRRYPRGEALNEMATRMTELSRERDNAERDFVALVEDARRAGVPNGTLGPYMDLADQIALEQRDRPPLPSIVEIPDDPSDPPAASDDADAEADAELAGPDDAERSAND